MRKTLCSVTDLMDHVINTSTAAYAGTERALGFFIFHDGLSTWWEALAQAYMRARGFEHRQIRNIDANKGTRYEGKIVGDSPEMCRALDSHGFADLKAAVFAYSSFTSVYAVDDPRRFKLGTPNELFRRIERAWTVAPTSKRIVEDILALPLVRSKIIEYKGCVVPDEVLRHGRRAAKWETSEMSTGDQKAKPRSFTQIETWPPRCPPIPMLALHAPCCAPEMGCDLICELMTGCFVLIFNPEIRVAQIIAIFKANLRNHHDRVNHFPAF